METNYVHILELCEVVIQQEYAPCGLENAIKKRLLDLTHEWEKRKRKADEQGKAIDGLHLIARDVFRAVGKAEANEKRFGKPRCLYLKRGLEIPPSQKGGLGYWFLAMRD